MIKYLRYLLYIAGFLWLGFYAYIWFGGKGSGDKAPEIKETLMNGDEFELSDLKGEYVLLSFWGSWCAPCLKENPELVSLYTEFSGKQYQDAADFKVISIAIEKSAKRTPALIERFNMNWPFHIIQESNFVMQAPLALSYGVTDLPTKYLIGPDGRIIGKMSLEEVATYLRKRMR